MISWTFAVCSEKPNDLMICNQVFIISTKLMGTELQPISSLLLEHLKQISRVTMTQSTLSTTCYAVSQLNQYSLVSLSSPRIVHCKVQFHNK